MNDSLSTQGRSESNSSWFGFLARKSASAWRQLRTFAWFALSWTEGAIIRVTVGMEVPLLEDALEKHQKRLARLEGIDQGETVRPGQSPGSGKPQFIGGPLDGLDGFALDSPSQDFYFPSMKGRFVYYACDGQDWCFIG